MHTHTHTHSTKFYIKFIGPIYTKEKKNVSIDNFGSTFINASVILTNNFKTNIIYKATYNIFNWSLKNIIYMKQLNNIY